MMVYFINRYDPEIVYLTTDPKATSKYRIVVYETDEKLIQSIHDNDITFDNETDAITYLELFKRVKKQDNTPSIRNGAWSMEIALISSFAEKIGGSARESFEDMIINILAEEIKFFDDKQWAIDDIITTPLKAIFDTIPKLQRKVMVKGLEHLTSKSQMIKMTDTTDLGSPLLAIWEFLAKEYALD